MALCQLKYALILRGEKQPLISIQNFVLISTVSCHLMFSLFSSKLRTFDFKSRVHKTVGDRHLPSAERTGWSRKDRDGEVWRVKLCE